MAVGEGIGARFKGRLVIAARATMKKDLAGSDFERVLSQLSAPGRFLLTERVVATDWYPVDGAGQVVATVARELELDVDDYARRLGAGIVFESAGALGRVVMSLFGSPQRIAKHMHSMWRQLYDSGRIHARFDEASGTLLVDRYGWQGHDPRTCFNMLGSIEEIASHVRRPRLLSAKRLCCVDDGSTHCRFEVRYSMGS